MNKKIFFCFWCVCVAAAAQAQSRRIDTVAVGILDKMSATIGDLASCSVVIHANYDIVSSELGLVKHSDEVELFLHGPDKLLERSEGDRGTRSFIYNGTTLSYYSQDKNQYGQIPATGNLVSMIDTVNKEYGIEFPGADFFYPTFVDDIMMESKALVYLGLTRVGGKECFHIAGVGQDKTYQFWVSNDAWCLPMKMVIVYTEGGQNRQYEATMTDWQINPGLPDALFEFTAPPRARKIKLVPIANRKNITPKP